MLSDRVASPFLRAVLVVLVDNKNINRLFS